MTRRICRDCAGPFDILHTKAECDSLRQVSDVPEGDRYHLSVIAAIIDSSPSPIAAARKLYAEGLLGVPEVAS